MGTEGINLRYHLWFAPASRLRPYGVRDSLAVTGETRPVPYPRQLRFGRLLQGVSSQGALSPFHHPGALCTGYALLRVLFFAVVRL